MKTNHFATVVLTVAFGAAAASGGEGSLGYRGINNSGHYPATGLLKAWPETGPELLWKYDTGIGFAGVTVYGGKVYVAGGETNVLYVFSLDGRLESAVKTGSSSCARFSGTRSTPLVKDGVAVTTVPDSNIYAVDLARRSVKWQASAWRSFGAGKGNMGWGFPESPLLFEDKVIFNACSRLDETPPIIAVDISTGKMVWGSDAGKDKNYSAADCSGSLIRHGGKDLVIWPTWRYLVCLDARTGKRLWEIADTGEKSVTPVYGEGGYLLWSPGGKVQMLKLSPDATSYKVLWTRGKLCGNFSHAVVLDKRVYAFGGTAEQPECEGGGTGPATKPAGKAKPPAAGGEGLLCLDAETGSLIHSIPSGPAGHVVAADGMVYAAERTNRGSGKKPGILVSLIKPTADGFEVAGRLNPDLNDAELNVSEVEWQASVNPVVAEGRLFLRYGPLQAYELRADKTAEIKARKQKVAAFVEGLKSAKVADRLAAMKELRAMGWQAQSAAAPLAEALKDGDVRARTAAAELLAEIGEPAVPMLLAALRDEKIWAEGLAGKALTKATAGAASLAEALVAAAEKSQAMREDVEAVIARLGADGAKALVRPGRDGGKKLRWWCISIMKSFGRDARECVPFLVEAIAKEDQWFKANAAEALGRIGPDAKAAVPALVGLLKHDYPKARAAAAAALGEIADASRDVLSALEAAAGDKDAETAKAAAASLRKLR